ncbi:ATP synthase subunit I [Sessilibacter sp. MAH2]
MNRGSIQRPPVFKASFIQLILLVATTVLAYLLSSKVIAYSILLGGLLVVLPNVYFAFYAFRFMGSRQVGSALHSIYRGEMGKFTLTLVGFALVFLLVKPLHSQALFSAFVVTTVIHWITTSKLVVAPRS